MAIQHFIAYSEHLPKSRDQRTVAYLTLYSLIRDFKLGLKTAPITISTVLVWGVKLQDKTLLKEQFSLSAKAFNIKPEVACYVVT